jgi:L-alanine-DL-glutamate epimerase-like enolase superfamily enzyme
MGDDDASAPAVEVNILVDGEHLAAIEQVHEALVTAGLRDSQVLATSGVIVGAVDAARLDVLGGVAGVAAVERSREIRVPPPDAPGSTPA